MVNVSLAVADVANAIRYIYEGEEMFDKTGRFRRVEHPDRFQRII